VIKHFDLDKALKALACGTRRHIFEIISHPEGTLPPAAIKGVFRGEREVCVCHIVEKSGLANSTVSHHLAVLKEAGLIEARREGVWIYYRVNRRTLKEMKAMMAAL